MDMNLAYSFEILRTTRQNVLRLLEALTPEQLNTIPTGFNNNLIWNAGHIIATQQLLCYGLSGSAFRVDPDWIEGYRKGSRPEESAGAAELARVMEWLTTTAEQLDADYQSGYFGNFKTYPTSYGMTLGSIEEAITFNNVHEGMHLGTMLTLRKLS